MHACMRESSTKAHLHKRNVWHYIFCYLSAWPLLKQWCSQVVFLTEAMAEFQHVRIV